MTQVNQNGKIRLGVAGEGEKFGYGARGLALCMCLGPRNMGIRPWSFVSLAREMLKSNTAILKWKE